MSESLQSAKTRLSSKYLGRGGIHAIGTRPSEVVSVYYSGPPSQERSEVFRQIQAEAEPFKVIFIEEEAARAADAKTDE